MIVQPDGSVKETVGSIAPVVGGVSMATYKQIVECVKRCTGRTVKTCWIAEVKRELGLSTLRARPSTRRRSGTVSRVARVIEVIVGDPLSLQLDLPANIRITQRTPRFRFSCGR